MYIRKYRVWYVDTYFYHLLSVVCIVLKNLKLFFYIPINKTTNFFKWCVVLKA